jgi:hypothetical protein
MLNQSLSPSDDPTASIVGWAKKHFDIDHSSPVQADSWKQIDIKCRRAESTFSRKSF